jgi:hypothetical protein
MMTRSITTRTTEKLVENLHCRVAGVLGFLSFCHQRHDWKSLVARPVARAGPWGQRLI